MMPESLVADSPAEPAAVKRTGEIEEVTNRVLIHPVAHALVVRLARVGVSPNAVSIVGFILGACAALAYLEYRGGPLVVLLGFVLMLGWHVMDGADGQLARLTGQTSEIGKALDGLCDHGTFVLVYLALGIAAAEAQGAWVWIWAVLAGASHAVQANTYEAQRYAYDYWVQGKQTARIPTPDEFRQEQRGARGTAWALGKLHLFYLSVQHRSGKAQAPLRDALEAARRAPGGTDRVAGIYRDAELGITRAWNLLCSNYRTVAIAVACLAGSAVYFFVVEVVVLNVVFAGLLVAQRRTDRALLARLTESGSGSGLD